jgi:hypothetical protein
MPLTPEKIEALAPDQSSIDAATTLADRQAVRITGFQTSLGHFKSSFVYAGNVRFQRGGNFWNASYTK